MPKVQAIIKTAESLDLADFTSLLNNDILAIRIPGFAESKLCDIWTQKLLDANKFQRYLNAPDVGITKVGMALFETQSNHALLETYFNEAKHTGTELNTIFDPFPNPLHWIQSQVREIWPNGVNVGVLNGKKMCPGIVRWIEEDNPIGLPPHQDLLYNDLPEDVNPIPLKAQLAANLYIQAPTIGGELELWDPDLSFFSKDIYTGHHDFIDRDALPNPAEIKPQKGELILFRSDAIHAVKSIQAGYRITASCFLGFTNKDEPICYWS